jgi:hypothetical protein
MMAKQVLDGEKLPFDNDSGTITITTDKVDAHLALLQERGLVNQN